MYGWLARRTRDQDVAGSNLAVPLSRNDCASRLHTCASVNKQYNLVQYKKAALLCGWEGNRGPGEK